MSRHFRLALTTAALLICTTLPSHAQSILGAGNASCGTLVDKDRFHTGAPEMQWLLGYITASARFGVVINYGKPTQLSENVDNQSLQDIIDWAQGWCSSHRSDDLDDVARRYNQISGNI